MWGPYNYAFNNPVRFIDPNGMDPSYGYGPDPSSLPASWTTYYTDDQYYHSNSDDLVKGKFLLNRTTGVVTFQPVSDAEYDSHVNGGGDDPKITVKKIMQAFNDGKAAKSYSFTIYVQQPVQGDRHSKLSEDNWVGHTFISLTKNNEDGSSVAETFGFYPAGKGGDVRQPEASSSTFRDDLGHPWTESLTKAITSSQFNSILVYAQAEEFTSYNLNTNNCTTFGYFAALKAGISIRDGGGTWPLGGKGYNPASLGQSILEGKYSNFWTGGQNGITKDTHLNLYPYRHF